MTWPKVLTFVNLCNLYGTSMGWYCDYLITQRGKPAFREVESSVHKVSQLGPILAVLIPEAVLLTNVPLETLRMTGDDKKRL